jgi:NADPH:quinone reductase-like Zn-dependent oxidoreductase
LRIVCFLVPIVLATSGALSAAGPPTMQAAVVSGSRIQLQQVPRPVPTAGEVLVKLQYASVNPADWKRASGRPEDLTIGAPRPGQPQIPGMDGAGTIEALGPGVTTFKVGDAVLLWSRHGGSYAGFVSVSAKDVARLPDGLDVAQAAAIPHAALAAWTMLVDVARVQPGQTVLVLGGAGGVGSAAVQIAAIRGAHVTATASARNAQYLQQIGAEHVIDYGSQHFEEQLRNIDVVVNAVDADNAYRGLAVIKQGGYLVSVAGLPLPAQCAERAVTCAARTVAPAGAREALTQLAQWTRSGRLKVNIDRSFELSAVLQAWAYSQAGHTRGKAVIHIIEDRK